MKEVASILSENQDVECTQFHNVLQATEPEINTETRRQQLDFPACRYTNRRQNQQIPKQLTSWLNSGKYLYAQDLKTPNGEYHVHRHTIGFTACVLWSSSFGVSTHGT